MHRFGLPSAVALLVALLSATPFTWQTAAAATATDAESTPGAQVFRDHCAGCHEGQQPGAPAKQFLQMMVPSAVVGALTSGMMAEEGRSLSAVQKEQVAAYLTGGPPGVTGVANHPVPLCRGLAARFDLAQLPAPFGWGHDNSRFTPARVAGLPASAVPHLRLAWAFAFPNAIRARSQPAIAYGAVYVGSQDGTVYALALKSGCVRWMYHAPAEVRTGMVLAAPGDGVRGPRLFFGDLIGHVYSLDALTGHVIWRVKVTRHPDATLTGTPSLHAGRLYVPVSSLEEVTAAAKPRQACCTFRGSVVALDAESGALRWRTYMIDKAPQPSGVTSSGVAILGPSGAPVWNSPTIDARRGVLYVGTGDNYTGPADASSDALVALRLNDGKMVWQLQTFKNDVWNAACMGKRGSLCPADAGPDADYGASPILATLPAGGDVLLGGEKSGVVTAVDPARATVLWSKRVGRGGIQGGVEFGMAAAGGRVFVPISDMKDEHDGRTFSSPGHPGLFAFDASTGRPLWSAPARDTCGSRPFCDPGITAAITAIPGVVFAGHLDGVLRAYDASSGRVLWQFDALRKFATVSGAVAQGGSFGGPGPVVRAGYLVVNSGYGLYFHMPGNVLLAFNAAIKQRNTTTRARGRPSH